MRSWIFGILLGSLSIFGIAASHADDSDQHIFHLPPAQPWKPALLTANQSSFLEDRALLGHKLLEALKAGGNAGNIQAIRQTAIYYSQIKDYPKSVRWWRVGAKNGDSYSEYELGYFLLQGPGVAHNQGKAIFWLKKSAAGNSIQGRDLLASVYLSEPGKAALAVEEWRKAAQNGSAWSANQIADGYAKGMYGLPKDHTKYEKWEHIRNRLQLASFNRPDPFQVYLREKKVFDYYRQHGTLPGKPLVSTTKPSVSPNFLSSLFYLFFFGSISLITISMFYQKKRTRALPQGTSPFYWLLATVYTFGISAVGWIWLIMVPGGDTLYYILTGFCYGIQSILAYQIWRMAKSGDIQKTEKIAHQA